MKTIEAKELPAQVTTVLDYLKRLKIPAVVAGGFVRDLASGRAWSDVDIITWGEYRALKGDVLIGLLSELGYVISSTEDSEDYPIKDNHRVISVTPPQKFTSSEPPLKIDIIFRKAGTLEDALHSFDCNMNQYVLHVYPGYLCTAFYGENHGVLTFNVANGFSEERLEHMQRVAKEIGWEVPDFIRRQVPPQKEYKHIIK